MSWRTEWKAISDRIEGLLVAGQLFAQFLAVRTSDSYGAAKKELIPHARLIFEDIMRFHDNYVKYLSPTAVSSLKRFIELHRHQFIIENLDTVEGMNLLLSCLASIRSEFTYQISDVQAIARRVTERAFIHLQRSIVADETIRVKWKQAFSSHETACEKLGAAHLLSHGIWAFKASAEGERTDLVLGEPLKDISVVESVAEAMVLTEWKLCKGKNPQKQLQKEADQALKQAQRYSAGIMAGFELASYRYLVIVSEKVLEMQADINVGDVTYRFVNIAVDPLPPSKG